jgi:VanZ family protein
MRRRAGSTIASSRRWASLLAGIALFALVVALTLVEETPRPQFIPGQDKLEHLLAFLALGFCFGWGATGVGLLAAGVALAGAAFAIEAMQEALTLTREGAPADAYASLVGLACGLCAAAALSAAPRWFGAFRARGLAR